MPCSTCMCFNEGRDRWGNRISGGKGYCEIWDEEYYRSHECSKYAPVFGYGGNSSSNEKGGCFLTSACTEYLGLPDDCEELTVLRNFRDSVLKTTSEGKALVEEYYRIAPDLVNKINASMQKDEIYKNIYKQITECIDAIGENKNDLAVQLYKSMVEYVTAEVEKSDGNARS